MKTLRFSLILNLLVAGFSVYSQHSILPEIEVFSLEGSRQRASELIPNGNVTVLFFWNAENRSSLEQAQALNDEYKNELKEMGVNVIGIYTDYSGSMAAIRPLVNGLGIDFEVYIDRNNDLKRAMNIPEVPFTMIISGDHEIYRNLYTQANTGEFISKMYNNSLAKAKRTK